MDKGQILASLRMRTAVQKLESFNRIVELTKKSRAELKELGFGSRSDAIVDEVQNTLAGINSLRLEAQRAINNLPEDKAA